MKQVRVLSNAIAEELRDSLSKRGIVLEGTAFEDKVGGIVASVYEAVEDTDKEEIVEDTEIYISTASATIGGKEVADGEYVEFEETENGIIATIYDEDGEIKEEEVAVTEKEKKAFLANAEELEDDDEDYYEDEDDVEEGCDSEEDDEVEEGCDSEEDDEVEEAVGKFKVKNGKKVKLSKNQLKAKRLRAAGRLKKGFKLSADGKIVKMSAAEKKARKKLGKKLVKKGKAKRKKSLAKARKINSGAVKEGFDITSSNGLKIAVEEGDTLLVENNLLSVIREGNVIISGVEVHEGFIQNCIAEEVLTPADDEENLKKPEIKEGEEQEDEVEEGEEEEETNEAALLTFKANKGYVLVKEGKEQILGNRIRARATLLSEGYNVTSDSLNRANSGEVVTL